MLFSDDS